MSDLWRRIKTSLARLPVIRPCVHFYQEHSAQVRFLTLTALMAIFVLILLGVVITVTNLDPKGKHSSTGSVQVRRYYIAADEVMWDYAPDGYNKITGLPFNEAENFYIESGPQRIGKVYKKAVFREYTDGSFTQLKPMPSQSASNGILGPILYAQTGDTIRVVFKNNASFPLNILAEGVISANGLYMPASNRSVSSASYVLPGDTWTYEWYVGTGPDSDSDPSTSLWSYYSRVDAYDSFAGPIGGIVLTYPGNLIEKVDATTGLKYPGLKDIDREVFALFAVFDENLSHYFDQNIAMFLGNSSGVDKNDPQFIESNRKYTINGYLYGNFPEEWKITANTIARWNVLSLNGARDNHRPFWVDRIGSLTFSEASLYFRIDAISLMPGEEKIIDMDADRTGRTTFECQIAQNARAGMLVAYSVVS